MKKSPLALFLVSLFLLGYQDPQQQKVASFYNLTSDYAVKTKVISKSDSIPEELKFLPKYVAGVAIPERGEIYLFKDRTNSYPFGSLEQVYVHELSHIYIYRAVGFRVPRWFDEGVAMKLSGEWSFSDEFYLALSLPKIALSDFNLYKLENDFVGYEGASRTSYALSRAFVKDLFVNERDLQIFIQDIKDQKSFEIAFFKRFNLTPDSAFKAWAKKLPWWGPILFVITSSNAIWFFVVFLFLLASFVTIRRRLKWKKKWEEEEKDNDYLQ